LHHLFELIKYLLLFILIVTGNIHVNDPKKASESTGTAGTHSQSKAQGQTGIHEETHTHSPRRNSNAHEPHKNTSNHSNTQPKTTTHGKSPTRSPRRKSDAHESLKDTHDHSSTQGKATTHGHTNTYTKAPAHRPRRKSDAHQSQKDTQDENNPQKHKSDKAEQIGTFNLH
jgi:hypothetical protein